MTLEAHRPLDEGALIRRIHKARVRQWVVAGISLLMAILGVTFLSVKEIGSFAYYTLIALMLLNAITAIRQCILVIFPIETLLRSIRALERAIDRGKLDIGHLDIHAEDAFACLAAGIDDLVTKLSEKARISSEQALLNAAMIQAMPFAIFTVSKEGQVYTIIRDMFNLIELLNIKVGQGPSVKVWGKANINTYLTSLEKCFNGNELRWFDLDIGTHHLRGCAKRINALSIIVAFGDMPAIDKSVHEQSGRSNENDFTHKHNTLKHLAASVAHDGKNVLATIQNLVEINRHSTDPIVLQQIPIVEDALRRGTSLMQELSTFSGDVHLKLKCVPAEKLMDVVSSPTIKALIPDSIKLSLEMATTPMPQIDLDIDQMWKVAFNIVKNATEALGGNNGQIFIRIQPYVLEPENTKEFHCLSTLRTGPGVLLSLSDDGGGIPSPLLEHIFDPYYSSKGEGRGIGLTTALTIVNAHGGGIRVHSSLSCGTTFAIFLPASRNTDEELKLMQEIAPNGEILLVDDDPSILHTTSLVLRMAKIAAHPAATEEDALAKVRSLRSRLRAAIIDGSIEDICSAQLVNRIHKEMPGLPIIISSGSPKERINRDFEGVPYDCFLEKPYALDELLKVLEETAPKT